MHCVLLQVLNDIRNKVPVIWFPEIRSFQQHRMTSRDKVIQVGSEPVVRQAIQGLQELGRVVR